MSSSRKRLFAEVTSNANGGRNNKSQDGDEQVLKVAAVNHKPIPRLNNGMPSPLRTGNSLFRTVTLDTRVINAGSKTFNDPIHKFIKLEGICLRIVDTYQFQRLHSLKQLGVCDYVFRGATHSRFTHSLGVAHLAEKLARTIMQKQPELRLTEVDIVCIKVAGLCHDLGHGPFSHVYDGVFIKTMYPRGIDAKGNKWRHEDGSVRMLQHLLADNKIDIARYGLSPQDMLFIEEVIGGVKEEDRKGREPEKFFLYDIVNNALSGLDVDKLDYFQRDMKMANVKLQGDFDRFIDLARVLPSLPILSLQGRRLSHGTPKSAQYVNMICYPEKMLHECLNAFATRFHMHTLVYTHRSVKCVEFMICDALEAADPHIRIEGSPTEAHPDGLYKMSECIQDMRALSNLKDSIIDIIRYERNPELSKAKEIVRRIDNRDLYVCVGTSSFTKETHIHTMTTDAIINEIVACANTLVAELSNNHNGTARCLFNKSASNCSLPVIQEQHSSGSSSSTASAAEDNEDEEDDEDSKLFADFTSNNLKSHSSSQAAPASAAAAAVAATAVTAGAGNGDADNDTSVMMDHSQSSNFSTSSSSHRNYDLNLMAADIIVEKTHIHYGLGDQNPVARMRFYSKHSSGAQAIGKDIDERTYASILPRVFEDRKVRVFCRSPQKEYIARKAFEEWCRGKDTHAPFPTKCESPTPTSHAAGDVDEMEGVYEGGEDGQQHGLLMECNEWTQFSQYE